MGREIEIKIPLTDAEYDKIFRVISGEQVLAGVIVTANGLEHLFKTDIYFSRYASREESKAAGEPQVIRIRSEKKVGDQSAGQETERAFFCIKRKKIENGIELNREDETFVEKPEVIRDLLLFSGYHQFFEKNKDAYGVHCQSVVLPGCDFHLELEQVNGLKYIEVEVTDGSDNADDVRKALEGFIEQFGLDASKKDKRSWMEIINGGAK